MLTAHLETLEQNSEIDAGGAQRLAEKAGKIEELDFFQVKRAAEFLQKNSRHTTEEAFEDALKSEYQNYDFDKVEQMMKIAKIMYPNSEYDASREAIQRWYWDLDLTDTELVLKTVLARKFEYEDFD